MARKLPHNLGYLLKRHQQPLLFLGIFAIYLLLVSFSFRLVPVGDHVWDLIAAESLFREVSTHYLKSQSTLHPPYYSITISQFAILFDLSIIQSAKVIGVLCFMLSLLLIYAIASRLCDNANGTIPPLLACLLYALNPAAIQGSQVLKMDTSILTVALLIFIYAFVIWHKRLNRSRVILLGGLFGLVLMAKTTTGLVVPLTVFLFFLLRRDYGPAVRVTSGILLWGFASYYLVWWMTKKLYPFAFSDIPIFAHITSALGDYIGGSMSKDLTGRAKEWMKGSIVALWFTLPLCLLWLVAVGKSFKDYRSSGRIEASHFLILYSCIIFGAYFFSGGLAHGFPRFQYPALSACTIIVAVYIVSSIDRFQRLARIYVAYFLISLLAFLVFDLAAIGDIVYTAYYNMRLSMAFEGVSSLAVLTKLAAQIGLISLMALVSFGTVRFLFRDMGLGSVFILSLTPLILSCSLSQDIRHIRADYLTGYNYGSAGAADIVEFIGKEGKAGKKILATDSITFHYLGVLMTERLSDVVWNEPDRFKAKVLEDVPDIIVYGLPSNTVEQYRKTFNNEDVQRFLSARYVKRSLGHFTIWEKKRGMPRDP